MSKTAFARVLCDNISHGLAAGALLEADAALIKALAAEGIVDPHKDAVAYARANAAPVVRSMVELAAEQLAADADALRVQIAKLEDLSTKADEATRAALQRELAEAQAALADLLA